MCAGAHNRSAAIERTRKDRSQVDASRQQKRAAAKEISRGRVGAPGQRNSSKIREKYAPEIASSYLV